MPRQFYPAQASLGRLTEVQQHGKIRESQAMQAAQTVVKAAAQGRFSAGQVQAAGQRGAGLRAVGQFLRAQLAACAGRDRASSSRPTSPNWPSISANISGLTAKAEFSPCC